MGGGNKEKGKRGECESIRTREERGEMTEYARKIERKRSMCKEGIEKEGGGIGKGDRRG